MEESLAPQRPPDVDWPVLVKNTQTKLTVDELKDLNLNYYKNHYNFHIHELRRMEGFGVPMAMISDRLAVNMAGSQVMDDVLTGRCDHIHFEDYMKRRKRINLSELKNLQENL